MPHCAGKRPLTKRGAKKMILRLRTLGDEASHGLNWYRCTQCHWWHVGHKRLVKS